MFVFFLFPFVIIAYLGPYLVFSNRRDDKQYTASKEYVTIEGTAILNEDTKWAPMSKKEQYQCCGCDEIYPESEIGDYLFCSDCGGRLEIIYQDEKYNKYTSKSSPSTTRSTKQDSFFNRKCKHPDPEVRMSAAEHMVDEKKLVIIARQDISTEVRVAAINRIGGLQVDGPGPTEDLEILLNDPDETIRVAAITTSAAAMKAYYGWWKKRLQNGPLSYNAILESKVAYGLIFHKIENKLIDIIKNDNYPDVRSAAIEAIRSVCSSWSEIEIDEMNTKLKKAGVEVSGNEGIIQMVTGNTVKKAAINETVLDNSDKVTDINDYTASPLKDKIAIIDEAAMRKCGNRSLILNEVSNSVAEIDPSKVDHLAELIVFRSSDDGMNARNMQSYTKWMEGCLGEYWPVETSVRARYHNAAKCNSKKYRNGKIESILTDNNYPQSIVENIDYFLDKHIVYTFHANLDVESWMYAFFKMK